MTQNEQAEASMMAHLEAQRSLALAYKKTFSTEAGKRVLADLLSMYPPDRPRIDARSTQANPMAAMIGSIHFDGSTAVTKRILDFIKEGEAKPTTPPIVTV